MRFHKNGTKTIIGLLFTVSFVIFGYLFCRDEQALAIRVISDENVINGSWPEKSGACMNTDRNAKDKGMKQEVIKKEDMKQEEEIMSTEKIAITFDDGPNPIYTPLLLEGLKERDVHATFFLLGESAEKYPDLVKQIKSEGHLIGNHTYGHTDLQNADSLLIHQEVIKTNEILKKITGEAPQFIRPPYGNHKDNLEDLTGMVMVLWTIDPLDWCSDDAAAIERRIEEEAHDNGIILMHDSSKSSLMAALTAIDNLKKAGYEFVTVDEILFE